MKAVEAKGKRCNATANVKGVNKEFIPNHQNQ